MAITTEDIKKLRDATGLSVMECKKALDEAEGDQAKAVEILKAKGAAVAAKKGERSLNAGAVVSYIHASGTIGTMVELLCETDFVAKNPEFKAIGYDIAMHVAAMNPADVAELLEQPFIKSPDKKVSDLINGAVQKFGERTELGRMIRFEI